MKTILYPEKLANQNDLPGFLLDIKWDSMLLVTTFWVDRLTLALKTFNSTEFWLLLVLMDNCLNSIIFKIYRFYSVRKKYLCRKKRTKNNLKKEKTNFYCRINRWKNCYSEVTLVDNLSGVEGTWMARSTVSNEVIGVNLKTCKLFSASRRLHSILAISVASHEGMSGIM